jgi:hypothetical protein
MNPIIVNQYNIDHVWPQVADDLQKACIRCGAHHLNAGILWEMCRSNQAFLILVMDGTEIMAKGVWRFDRPNNPHVFRCLMFAGKNMSKWLTEHREFISKLAKQNGATQLVTAGRKGWLRLFPDAEQIGEDYEVNL